MSWNNMARTIIYCTVVANVSALWVTVLQGIPLSVPLASAITLLLASYTFHIAAYKFKKDE